MRDEKEISAFDMQSVLNENQILRDKLADAMAEIDRIKGMAVCINSDLTMKIQSLEARCKDGMDAIEIAWGIIANASGGDWQKQSPEWVEAAVKWRDQYTPIIYKYMKSALSSR